MEGANHLLLLVMYTQDCNRKAQPLFQPGTYLCNDIDIAVLITHWDSGSGSHLQAVPGHPIVAQIVVCLSSK